MEKFRNIFEAFERSVIVPGNAQEIENIFSKSKFDLQMIPAIGNSGVDLVFGTKNFKDAENFDIKGIEKLLKPLGVKLNKSSKDYPGGSQIQSANWSKDEPNDPHEIYISLK